MPLQQEISVQVRIPQPYYFMKGECLKDTTTVSTSLSSFLTTIKDGLADYNVTNLGNILVAGLAIAAAPALCWFGYRFVKGKATKALFKGKL